jgi:hypothetical protein
MIFHTRHLNMQNLHTKYMHVSVGTAGTEALISLSHHELKVEDKQ